MDPEGHVYKCPHQEAVAATLGGVARSNGSQFFPVPLSRVGKSLQAPAGMTQPSGLQVQ